MYHEIEVINKNPNTAIIQKIMYQKSLFDRLLTLLEPEIEEVDPSNGDVGLADKAKT